MKYKDTIPGLEAAKTAGAFVRLGSDCEDFAINFNLGWIIYDSIGTYACVKAWPKAIIELRAKGPRGMRLFVSCVNKDRGPAVKKACASACIGCGICFKTCTHDAIVFENNVAYKDYAKCKLCRECEAMCPTDAIHGVGFPKPLDREGIKARIKERQAKAAEAAKAAKPVEKEEQ